MDEVMNGAGRSRNSHVAERHQAGSCVHHWVLGDVSRGAIRGTCRRCGANRIFPAVLELNPPPSQPEEEEEEVPTLDLPALAAAVSSLEKHALI